MDLEHIAETVPIWIYVTIALSCLAALIYSFYEVPSSRLKRRPQQRPAPPRRRQ